MKVLLLSAVLSLLITSGCSAASNRKPNPNPKNLGTECVTAWNRNSNLKTGTKYTFELATTEKMGPESRTTKRMRTEYIVKSTPDEVITDVTEGEVPTFRVTDKKDEFISQCNKALATGPLVGNISVKVLAFRDEPITVRGGQFNTTYKKVRTEFRKDNFNLIEQWTLVDVPVSAKSILTVNDTFHQVTELIAVEMESQPTKQ